MPLPAETIAGAGSVLGVTVSLAKEGLKELKSKTARSKAKDAQKVLNRVQQTLINEEGDLVLTQTDHDNYHGEYIQIRQTNDDLIAGVQTIAESLSSKNRKTASQNKIDAERLRDKINRSSDDEKLRLALLRGPYSGTSSAGASHIGSSQDYNIPAPSRSRYARDEAYHNSIQELSTSSSPHAQNSGNPSHAGVPVEKMGIGRTPRHHSQSQSLSGLSRPGRISDNANTQASSAGAHQTHTRRPSRLTVEPTLSYQSQTHIRQRRPSHPEPSIPITTMHPTSRSELHASPDFHLSDPGVRVHATTARHTSQNREAPGSYPGRAQYAHVSQAFLSSPMPSETVNYVSLSQPHTSQSSVPSRPRRTSMDNSNSHRSRRSRRRPDLSDAHSDSEVEGSNPVVSRNDALYGIYAGGDSANTYGNPYVSSPPYVPSYMHPTQGHGAPSRAPVYTPQHVQYSAQNHDHFQYYGPSHLQEYAGDPRSG